MAARCPAGPNRRTRCSSRRRPSRPIALGSPCRPGGTRGGRESRGSLRSSAHGLAAWATAGSSPARPRTRSCSDCIRVLPKFPKRFASRLGKCPMPTDISGRHGIGNGLGNTASAIGKRGGLTAKKRDRRSGCLRAIFAPQIDPNLLRSGIGWPAAPTRLRNQVLPGRGTSRLRTGQGPFSSVSTNPSESQCQDTCRQNR